MLYNHWHLQTPKIFDLVVIHEIYVVLKLVRKPQYSMKHSSIEYFPIFQVYSTSAGPGVRHNCIQAFLRMAFHSPKDLLCEVLHVSMVSSHVAGMLASGDLKIIVGALQLSEILLQKMPEEFGVHFRREGVLHQVCPGVNFMSQKLRGIPPGEILLLTLIDSFLHFWLNVRLLSSFEETITPKLSRIYSQEEKKGKVSVELLPRGTEGVRQLH